MITTKYILCSASLCALLLTGCSSTYDDAYSEGYAAGYDEGYEYATDSHSRDYENGYDSGFDSGYDEGYAEGYSEAKNVISTFFLETMPPEFREQWWEENIDDIMAFGIDY